MEPDHKGSFLLLAHKERRDRSGYDAGGSDIAAATISEGCIPV